MHSKVYWFHYMVGWYKRGVINDKSLMRRKIVMERLEMQEMLQMMKIFKLTLVKSVTTSCNWCLQKWTFGNLLLQFRDNYRNWNSKLPILRVCKMELNRHDEWWRHRYIKQRVQYGPSSLFLISISFIFYIFVDTRN